MAVAAPTSSNTSPKPSFADTFGHFTGFARRRAAPNLTHSISSTAIQQHLRSPPPPSRIPRSSSFFGSLNALASKATGQKENQVLESASTKRSRLISERIIQTPFFTQHQQLAESPPVTPRRESTVQIPQRQLMAPIHPPLTRANPMGMMHSQSTPKTPSFMRPTSSSAARRTGRVVRTENKKLATGGKKAFTPPSQVNQSQIQSSPLTPRALSVSYEEPDSSPSKDRMSEDSSQLTHPADLDQKLPLLPSIIGQTNDAMLSSPSTQASRHVSFSVPLAHEHQESTLMSASDIEETTRTLQAIEALKLAPLSDDYSSNEDPAPFIGPARPPFIGPPLPPPVSVGINPRQVSPSSKKGSSFPAKHLIHPQIFEAQSSPYWSGRVMALSDRFRTEELMAPSGIRSNMHDDTRRMRRVFIHLRSLCMTDEARDSLAAFQKKYDEKMEREQGGNSKNEKKGVLEKVFGGAK